MDLEVWKPSFPTFGESNVIDNKLSNVIDNKLSLKSPIMPKNGTHQEALYGIRCKMDPILWSTTMRQEWCSRLESKSDYGFLHPHLVVDQLILYTYTSLAINFITLPSSEFHIINLSLKTSWFNLIDYGTFTKIVLLLWERSLCAIWLFESLWTSCTRQ